eukprot:TRINITY_DN82755_c0_g1_i1.p1 TRINITY_DN82755_c0_g1~~TRINITY_DN82755_c0_g1_i1.p1  ORF type:complete len:119 (-),score=23.46 TRINITY_DN82755_c0_g1_i1:38-394(-)
MEDEEVDVPSVTVPDSAKDLRACMSCGLVKTKEQFEREGCENCPFLESFSEDDYTTSSFSGTIALINPSKSFVAEFFKFRNGIPGMYAMGVHATPERQIVQRILAFNPDAYSQKPMSE